MKIKNFEKIGENKWSNNSRYEVVWVWESNETNTPNMKWEVMKSPGGCPTEICKTRTKAQAYAKAYEYMRTGGWKGVSE